MESIKKRDGPPLRGKYFFGNLSPQPNRFVHSAKTNQPR